MEQTGSGIETIAHLKDNGRIVVMFCAFSGPPRIVRLHGQGRAVLVDDPEFNSYGSHFPGGGGVGVRSIITVDVRRVADSCGYGVPLMTLEGHRPTMDEWAARKGEAGIRAYWSEKNLASIDALDGLRQRSREDEPAHLPVCDDIDARQLSRGRPPRVAGCDDASFLALGSLLASPSGWWPWLVRVAPR